MTFNDALTAAIAKAGGIRKFARGMGVTHQAVYHWRKTGYLTLERALQVEDLTGVSHRLLVRGTTLTALDKVAGNDLI